MCTGNPAQRWSISAAGICPCSIRALSTSIIPCAPPPVSAAPFRHYGSTDGELGGLPASIARPGNTGEDGFEVFWAREHAVNVWNAILDAGKPAGIKPCGLGARNTLRLESKMALYGHK